MDDFSAHYLFSLSLSFCIIPILALQSQYQRGLSVLGASGWLVVHGLGQTVPHAINLALLLQAAVSSPATVHTNTSTVYLPGGFVIVSLSQSIFLSELQLLPSILCFFYGPPMWHIGFLGWPWWSAPVCYGAGKCL